MDREERSWGGEEREREKRGGGLGWSCQREGRREEVDKGEAVEAECAQS